MSLILSLVGIVIVLVLAIVILVSRNRRLTGKNRQLEQGIRQANERLAAFGDLDHARTKNRKEAEDEKKRLDETPDSELVDDANSLFP